jgi:hypothetical protein
VVNSVVDFAILFALVQGNGQLVVAGVHDIDARGNPSLLYIPLQAPDPGHGRFPALARE